jgi:hypothetical protein
MLGRNSSATYDPDEPAEPNVGGTFMDGTGGEASRRERGRQQARLKRNAIFILCVLAGPPKSKSMCAFGLRKASTIRAYNRNI